MKFDFKQALILFAGLTIFGMLVEYFYALAKEIDFDFPIRTVVFYAVFSILYGFWKAKKK